MKINRQFKRKIMLKNKLAILLTGGFLSSALGFTSFFTQPAWAISRVSDQLCRDRTDFFKLWNNTTIANGVCFANAGSINVHIYNVYRITNGNNYGYIRDSTGRSVYFCQKNLRVNITPSIRDVVYVNLSASAPRACQSSYQLGSGEYRYGNLSE